MSTARRVTVMNFSYSINFTYVLYTGKNWEIRHVQYSGDY